MFKQWCRVNFLNDFSDTQCACDWFSRNKKYLRILKFRPFSFGTIKELDILKVDYLPLHQWP